jgi:hypothetical protein
MSPTCYHWTTDLAFDMLVGRMQPVTASPKFQVVIPSAFREQRRIEPGQRLQVLAFYLRISDGANTDFSATAIEATEDLRVSAGSGQQHHPPLLRAAVLQARLQFHMLEGCQGFGGTHCTPPEDARGTQR